MNDSKTRQNRAKFEKKLQGLDKEYRLILVSDDCTVANGFRTYYNMTAPSQQNDQLTVLI